MLQQLRQAPDWLAIVGVARLTRLAGGLNQLLRKHPRKPPYYLPFVGVDPSAQGRGLGKTVLRPVLERCDALGLSAYLENTNARNLALYERLGFRVLEELVVARDGPSVWCMWRDPAGRPAVGWGVHSRAAAVRRPRPAPHFTYAEKTTDTQERVP
jgi:ribosomal protein S18 acetylase RimI-like enzyme